MTDFSKFPSIGGSNGYSVLCDEVHLNSGPTHASYTICQHTVLAFKDNRLPEGSFQECAKAIGAGRCQAVKMMMEEIKSGQRIYYIDRLEEMRKLKEEMERGAAERAAGYQRGSVFGTRKTPKSEAKEAAPLVDVYSEAVGAEVKKTKENT